MIIFELSSYVRAGRPEKSGNFFAHNIDGVVPPWISLMASEALTKDLTTGKVTPFFVAMSKTSLK